MAEGTIFFLVLVGGLLLLALVAIGGGLVITWLNSREETRGMEREAALKKEMLNRGMTVEDIERVIRASAIPPKQPAKIEDEDAALVGEFGGLLGSCGAKPDAIAEILAIVRDADSATKRSMLSAVKGMADNAPEYLTDEQLRAAVTALSRPTAPSKEPGTPEIDLPPLTGTPSRYPDSIRISERKSM